MAELREVDYSDFTCKEKAAACRDEVNSQRTNAVTLLYKPDM